MLWTIAHGYSTIGTLLTCDRWVSCAIWENRDSEIGLWVPNCTRYACTILLTTTNFRTLFFPNSTTDPPIYIILLYPDERRPTTVRSNDTLVDTPFQLISGFFHVNQGILCSEHAEQASSRGVLERGGQQPEVD